MESPQHLLREAGLRPRKAWGQNFLVHSSSAEKIVRFAQIIPGDRVLEIGPGLGAMTEALTNEGANVIAIERDPKLVEILNARWRSAPQITLVSRDALEVNFNEYSPPLRVVSNLPYHVSTPILERLSEHRRLFQDLTLLLQEEVIDRMTAKPNSRDYGRLSVGIQTLFDVERGPRIPRGSFYPVPDVESRLIKLTPLKKPLVGEENISAFLDFVGKLFSQRRKTLRRILKNLDSESSTDIDLSRRPESLSIQELDQLFQTTLR